jgi:hypothetical protein
MIDNLALGLSHGLMMLAAFPLLKRPRPRAEPTRLKRSAPPPIKLAFVHDTGPVVPITTVVFLTIVLAASIALCHALERPAQRWINSWSFKV